MKGVENIRKMGVESSVELMILLAFYSHSTRILLMILLPFDSHSTDDSTPIKNKLC